MCRHQHRKTPKSLHIDWRCLIRFFVSSLSHLYFNALLWVVFLCFPSHPVLVPKFAHFVHDFPSTHAFKKGETPIGGFVIFKLGQFSVLFDCPDFYKSLPMLYVFCFCCFFFFFQLHRSNAWQLLLPLCLTCVGLQLSLCGGEWNGWCWEALSLGLI